MAVINAGQAVLHPGFISMAAAVTNSTTQANTTNPQVAQQPLAFAPQEGLLSQISGPSLGATAPKAFDGSIVVQGLDGKTEHVSLDSRAKISETKATALVNPASKAEAEILTPEDKHTVLIGMLGDFGGGLLAGTIVGLVAYFYARTTSWWQAMRERSREKARVELPQVFQFKDWVSSKLDERVGSEELRVRLLTEVKRIKAIHANTKGNEIRSDPNILLVGPDGSGKGIIAERIAGELGAPIIRIDLSILATEALSAQAASLLIARVAKCSNEYHQRSVIKRFLGIQKPGVGDPSHTPIVLFLRGLEHICTERHRPFLATIIKELYHPGALTKGIVVVGSATEKKDLVIDLQSPFDNEFLICEPVHPTEKLGFMKATWKDLFTNLHGSAASAPTPGELAALEAISCATRRSSRLALENIVKSVLYASPEERVASLWQAFFDTEMGRARFLPAGQNICTVSKSKVIGETLVSLAVGSRVVALSTRQRANTLSSVARSNAYALGAPPDEHQLLKELLVVAGRLVSEGSKTLDASHIGFTKSGEEDALTLKTVAREVATRLSANPERKESLERKLKRAGSETTISMAPFSTTQPGTERSARTISKEEQLTRIAEYVEQEACARAEELLQKVFVKKSAEIETLKTHVKDQSEMYGDALTRALTPFEEIAADEGIKVIVDRFILNPLG